MEGSTVENKALSRGERVAREASRVRGYFVHG